MTDLKLQSIEWLRHTMRGFTDFQCRCGKEFIDFDLWFNHMIISKHFVMEDSDIEQIKEYVAKIGQ